MTWDPRRSQRERKSMRQGPTVLGEEASPGDKARAVWLGSLHPLFHPKPAFSLGRTFCWGSPSCLILQDPAPSSRSLPRNGQERAPFPLCPPTALRPSPFKTLFSFLSLPAEQFAALRATRSSWESGRSRGRGSDALQHLGGR